MCASNAVAGDATGSLCGASARLHSEGVGAVTAVLSVHNALTSKVQSSRGSGSLKLSAVPGSWYARRNSAAATEVACM